MRERIGEGLDERIDGVDVVNPLPVITGPARKPRPLAGKPEDFADYPEQIGDGNLLGHDGPIAGPRRPDNAINPAEPFPVPSDTPLGFSEDPDRSLPDKDDEIPQIGSQPKQFGELLIPVENTAYGPLLPEPCLLYTSPSPRDS